MDIGTAKPSRQERAEIRHYMIDLVDPANEFSVSEFRSEGRKVMESHDGPLIVSGGSGLHFRALVDPLTFAPTDPGVRDELEQADLGGLVEELVAADPGAGSLVDLANKRRVVRAVEISRLGGGTPTERFHTAEGDNVRNYRPEVGFEGYGIDPEEALAERVAARLRRMQSEGLVDEVASLRGRMGRTARAAIGYREIASALERGTNLDEAFAEVEANTLKLARRQRTWFRRDPRIRWIPWDPDPAAIADQIMGVME